MSKLPVSALLEQCPSFFKALCEPNRIAMVIGLLQAQRPCTVSELATHCPVDLSVASRHLSVLRRAGVIHGEKKGRELFYTISASQIANTLRGFADALEACCGDTAEQA